MHGKYPEVTKFVKSDQELQRSSKVPKRNQMHDKLPKLLNAWKVTKSNKMHGELLKVTKCMKSYQKL